MKLIKYADWSRRSRGATPTSHPIGNNVRGVTFHWEGPHMGDFPHSACAEKVRGIQGFHRDGRGWADIAYNALVCPHGYVFEGRGPNVASAANGYSTANISHYAVCYLGGERDPLTDDGKQGFRDATGWLRDEGNAGPEINGHRDHKATACPGDQIYAWLKSGDAEPSEEITVGPIDFLRHKLFGAKQGNRTVADVLREDNRNLREIRDAVKRIEDKLNAPK